ncbi:MAG: heat-inducible transcriptional repressor HrcA [Corynebacterium sp.]|nr:heat-inducible transcriptional repressor HrcA [Corynebacterium sp.]
MSASAHQRRKDVLSAIVSDYIARQEPVGSKALVERHKLGVSSATIRNDMAVLEAEGLIAQTHTSSGRIPTEKGYRAFVDSIHSVKPLSGAERTAILHFLEEGVDVEDVLKRSVQLLSQLTHQVAMVQLPTLQASRIVHVEVVPMSPLRILLVVITDTGRVEQRHVDLLVAVTPEVVTQVRDRLNHSLIGTTMTEGQSSLTGLGDTVSPQARELMDGAVHVLVDTLVDTPSDKLIVAGAPYVANMRRELPAGLEAVLEALEEQVILLKLLSTVNELGTVSISIGEENEDAQLYGTSVVTAAYGSGALGVMGPTYMDYTGTISKVGAIANYVSQILGHE